MNTNLLPDPVRPVCLKLNELRRLINVQSWTRFEAACYLSGAVLLDFKEFQELPPGYIENLKKLLEDPSTDPGLVQAVQKYKTKYPEIEDTYNSLGQLSNRKMKKVKIDDKTNIIIEAEPMQWIKLAVENNLYVAPGIKEAWIIFQYRGKRRRHPMNGSPKESLDSKYRRHINSRPLHEPADIENVKELGRKLFRENLEWSKQKIAEEICKIYPRAKCYNRITIVKWLKQANIARRIKGGRKNLPNVV